MKEINRFIEHTILKPNVMQAEIEQLMEEAIQHHFLGICVPPYWVKKCKRDLQKTEIVLVTVAGFPLGYNRTEVKAFEVQRALEEGANEVDIVMNMTAFKNNPKEWVKPEIAQMANLCHQANAMLKVILETAYLTNEEIIFASKLCEEAGADFIKTSTGFAPSGANVENVRLMRQSVGQNVGIKASGGIKSYSQALELIQAGADRIGTSSGVNIIKEASNQV
jgi:deoxyribose-phosphate aldolase